MPIISVVKKYHLKAWLFLVVIVNITVLLTQLSNSKLPDLGQTTILVLNSSLSLLACWFIHAQFKMHPPVGWSRYFKLTISIMAGIGAVLLIDYLEELAIPQHLLLPAIRPSFQNRLLGSLFVSVICYVVFHVIFTTEMLQRTRLEVERLQQVNLRAQVIGLQQQLSPHFLFNSLSTIKSLAPDDTTKEFIMQLSLIYRYLIVSSEKQIVTLAEELEFVNAYLYVQQKRFGIALQINLTIPDIYLATPLPPLSVQLLIENAIKHNAFSHEAPLVIDIFVNADKELTVQNNRRFKAIGSEGLGLGLQNIKDRFQLLFNKGITVNSTVDDFTVSLPLNTYEDHHH